MSYLCTVCSTEQTPVEFDDRVKFMDHMRAHGEEIKAVDKRPMTPVAAIKPLVEVEAVKPQTPPKALKLEYVYKGECPDCRSPVETLLIDMKPKLVVVAFCPKCREQKAARPVVDLSKS